MKRVLLFIIINFAILCTLIVLIEISGQTIYYVRHGKFIFQLPETYIPPEYIGNTGVFELHPYLVGRPKKNIQVKNSWIPGNETETERKTITITNRNTRWTGAPEDDTNLIKVAVLGGSTAFGTGVTDKDTWPAILQSKLGNKFSIINHGVPGYSTAEAIIQLALIVPEVKPDFIILYEGWNDIHNYHDTKLGTDYYSHGMHQYYHLIIPIHKDNTLTLFERLCGLSAIARLASKYKLKILHPPKLQPSIAYDTPDPFVDRIYVRNLQTLKILSEQIAAYTIFVPQVLNYQAFWEEKEQNGSVGWTESITNRAMPSLMDRFNSLMNPVCAKEDYKCLVLDSVLNVKWKPQDFVDDGHFSRKGGEKFADVLSQVIQSKAKELGIYDGAK